MLERERERDELHDGAVLEAPSPPLQLDDVIYVLGIMLLIKDVTPPLTQTLPA